MLHHACSEGRAEMSELLIQAGANLDCKTPVCYISFPTLFIMQPPDILMC